MATVFEASARNRLIIERESPPAATVVAFGLVGVGLGLTGIRLGATLPAQVWLSSIGVTAVALGCAHLATTQRERKARSYILIGYLWPLSAAFTLGIASLAWTDDIESRAVSQSGIPAALLVAASGIIAWTLGYLAARQGPLTDLCARAIRAPLRLGKTADYVRARAARVLTVYVVTLSVRLFLLSASQFGYLAGADITTDNPVLNALRVISNLGPALLYLFAIDTLDNPRPRAILFLTMFAGLEVGIGLFSGGKQSAIVALIAVGLAFRARGHLGVLKIAVAGSFVVFAIFPLVEQYRAGVRPIDGPAAGPAAVLFADAIGDVVDTALSEPSTHVEVAVEDVTDRVRYVDSIAAVGSYVERSGTEHPSSVLRRTALLAIPRVLWPGKPIDTRSGDITQEIFLAPEGVQSASAITTIGDSYIHGRYLGLFVFMPLLGALARVLDVAFDIRRSDLLMVPFLLILPSAIKAEADIANSLISFARLMAMSAPLLWLLVGTMNSGTSDATSNGGRSTGGPSSPVRQIPSLRNK